MGSIVQSAIVPRFDGKPVSEDEFEQLRSTGRITKEEFSRIRDTIERYQSRLIEITAKVNEVRATLSNEAGGLWREEASSILRRLTEPIARDHDGPEVKSFLDDIVSDVVHRRRRALEKEADFTRLYRVNVILGHESGDSCSIVVETTPTLANLLGTIDHTMMRGEAAFTDHLLVRSGSLLRADGGYLIVEARDLLREPGAGGCWCGPCGRGCCKLFLRRRSFPGGDRREAGTHRRQRQGRAAGRLEIYYLLDEYDPDFPDLFKVLADFDAFVARDERGINDYARVLARIGSEERLPPFDRTAVAALVEHGARIAARPGMLTTRFGRLADIAREAAFVAAKVGATQVGAGDVRQAVARTKQRAELPSRRFRELVASGTIRVATRGAEVGQVNGLAVLQAGPLTYGFPARITATIGPGPPASSTSSARPTSAVRFIPKVFIFWADCCAISCGPCIRWRSTRPSRLSRATAESTAIRLRGLRSVVF